MKVHDFKCFISAVEIATKNSDIWWCGYYFMDLTIKQHNKLCEVLDTIGFIDVKYEYPMTGTKKTFILPSGIGVIDLRK